jgi:hypothetical protein
MPNQISTDHSYDMRDRLTAVTHSLNDTVLDFFNYTLDPTGTRTSVGEADGTTTQSSYDSAYRLTQELVSNPSSGVISNSSFTYDPNGNRLTALINGQNTNYLYNSLDQLVSGGTAAYTYDGRGNLTQVNDTVNGISTYSYGTANQLLTASGVSGSAAFGYDWGGACPRRLQARSGATFGMKTPISAMWLGSLIPARIRLPQLVRRISDPVSRDRARPRAITSKTDSPTWLPQRIRPARTPRDTDMTPTGIRSGSSHPPALTLSAAVARRSMTQPDFSTSGRATCLQLPDASSRVTRPPSTLSKITAAYGYVYPIPIGAFAANVALLSTTAGKKAVEGFAAVYADPDIDRTEYVAFSGTQKIPGRVQNLILPITAKFKIDVILGEIKGSDPCLNHPERKIERAAAKQTIFSISATRPLCQNCQMALWNKVDCLVPLGSNVKCGPWTPPLPEPLW